MLGKVSSGVFIDFTFDGFGLGVSFGGLGAVLTFSSYILGW